MKQITILGDGAFGTAFATLLAHNGHKVTLWCHNPTVAADIQTNHSNSKYLPNIKLSKNITATTDLPEALRNTIIFEAIPVKFMRSVVEQCKPNVTAEHRWIVLSKGIEQNNLLLPTQIIQDILGQKQRCAVIAGPSYADDLARQQPTGVNVAAEDAAFTQELVQLLQNDYFKLTPEKDMLSIQLMSAVKNVIAIGIGMLEGAGYSNNTQALFLMRMLAESKQLLATLNFDTNVIVSFAGIGDIVLTAFGKKAGAPGSRNHAVGVMLGQGKTLDTILQETGFIPEGVNTLQSLQQLAQKKNLTLPLCNAMHEVVFEKKNLETLIKKLSI